MFVQKWNTKLSKYEQYELPKGATLFEKDMDKKVNCARCGGPMIYGQGYTSRQIHTRMGLGFSVCRNCYQNEFEEERME